MKTDRFELTEELALRELPRPVLRSRAVRRNELRDQLSDLSMQRELRIACIPDECHSAAWAQHPVELWNRDVVLEPMERLSDCYCVHARGRKGYVLRRAAHRFGLWHSPFQLGTHGIARLDCDDTSAGVHERTSELARAGAEVEHDPI